MEERYLRHDLAERIVHWVMALSVLLLMGSGLNIRYPGLIPAGDMNGARSLHFISMYALVFSWLFHVYHTLAVERRTEIFGVSDLRNLPRTAAYYLFLADEPPAFVKYNPLQKLTYNLLWALIFVQALTGFGLYWPARLMAVNELMGGLMAVRMLHDFLMYVFASFIIVHLYLVLTEDIRALWAMFHGYYYRRSGG
ncbi:MAG TPA: hypothetical protein ENJ37_03175 [Deltaproteobacteria bacterium]|nr:hypothetical protein [Deltaproteobacteria bacterium]